MLRKIVWFAIVLFVGFIWFSQVMKSCGNNNTAQQMSDLGGNVDDAKEAIFKAPDEDAGDDEYIIRDDDDDSLADEYAEENVKENPRDNDFASATDNKSKNAEDFREKSPRKNTISRKAITETTYSSRDNADFLVIAGSFSSEANADRMVEKLKDMGYDDAEKIVFDFSQYYSVVSGKFSNEASAREISIELKNKSINAYVHKMRSRLY